MSNGKKVLNNFIWRLAERIGAQGVTFIVSIVLARLLNPAVYGTIALITVFISIMQVFVDSGLGTALIQKKDADDLDFSSVFYANVVFSLVLYGVMFFVAPYIAAFYSQPDLTPVIRVLSLVLIISGVKNVQQSYVSRNLLFKRFFWATLWGTIGAAIIGIWMAYKGYGVWALVMQMLFNSLVDTIVLWIMVKWRPKKLFSFYRLKCLWAFGWKMLVSAFLATIYTDLRKLIIGKIYSSEDLAYFDKGRQFPYLIVSNVNTSIDSVLLPTMAKRQDDIYAVRAMTKRSIKISTYIMFPMMMGIAVCAEPLVKILLTNKWLPCIPYLRIYCLTLSFYSIHTANLNAIKALGRSDIYLKVEIVKKIVGLVTLLFSIKLGVLAIAYAMIAEDILGQIICAWPNKKLIQYDYLQQFKDIIPQMALSLVMGVIVYAITLINVNDIFVLLLQFLAGTLIYLFGTKIFHIDSIEYLVKILKTTMPSRRGTK